MRSKFDRNTLNGDPHKAVVAYVHAASGIHAVPSGLGAVYSIERREKAWNSSLTPPDTQARICCSDSTRVEG